MPMCLSDDHIVWLLNIFPGHQDDDIAWKSCSKLFDASILDNAVLPSSVTDRKMSPLDFC